MDIIKVPKTPRSAYNPSRRASGLLEAQIKQLQAAAGVSSPQSLSRSRRTTGSEGEAARYIAALTRTLHPDGAGQSAAAMASPMLHAQAPATAPARAKKRTPAASTRSTKQSKNKRRPRKAR